MNRRTFLGGALGSMVAAVAAKAGLGKAKPAPADVLIRTDDDYDGDCMTITTIQRTPFVNDRDYIPLAVSGFQHDVSIPTQLTPTVWKVTHYFTVA